MKKKYNLEKNTIVLIGTPAELRAYERPWKSKAKIEVKSVSEIKLPKSKYIPDDIDYVGGIFENGISDLEYGDDKHILPNNEFNEVTGIFASNARSIPMPPSSDLNSIIQFSLQDWENTETKSVVNPLVNLTEDKK